MDEIWTQEKDVTVSEISTLEAHRKISLWGRIVRLPDDSIFDLRIATIDWNGDDIAGWRFEKDGKKYLVIND